MFSDLLVVRMKRAFKMTLKEEIQKQCWGKPSKLQLKVFRQYGYIPSSHGWLYLPWRLK